MNFDATASVRSRTIQGCAQLLVWGAAGVAERAGLSQAWC
jgi:hypothetical protein